MKARGLKVMVPLLFSRSFLSHRLLLRLPNVLKPKFRRSFIKFGSAVLFRRFMTGLFVSALFVLVGSSFIYVRA